MAVKRFLLSLSSLSVRYKSFGCFLRLCGRSGTSGCSILSPGVTMLSGNALCKTNIHRFKVRIFLLNPPMN